MYATATAVALITRAYCSHVEFISRSALETNLITFVAFCYVILLFCIGSEIKNCIESRKENNKCKEKRTEISCIDCDKERKIREFKKQREKFFEDYFTRSSIEMKTLK